MGIVIGGWENLVKYPTGKDKGRRGRGKEERIVLQQRDRRGGRDKR